MPVVWELKLGLKKHCIPLLRCPLAVSHGFDLPRYFAMTRKEWATLENKLFRKRKCGELHLGVKRRHQTMTFLCAYMSCQIKD